MTDLINLALANERDLSRRGPFAARLTPASREWPVTNSLVAKTRSGIGISY
jgi:hypothetical protein